MRTFRDFLIETMTNVQGDATTAYNGNNTPRTGHNNSDDIWTDNTSIIKKVLDMPPRQREQYFNKLSTAQLVDFMFRANQITKKSPSLY